MKNNSTTDWVEKLNQQGKQIGLKYGKMIEDAAKAAYPKDLDEKYDFEADLIESFIEGISEQFSVPISFSVEV